MKYRVVVSHGEPPFQSVTHPRSWARVYEFSNGRWSSNITPQPFEKPSSPSPTPLDVSVDLDVVSVELGMRRLYRLRRQEVRLFLPDGTFRKHNLHFCHMGLGAWPLAVSGRLPLLAWLARLLAVTAACFVKYVLILLYALADITTGVNF